MSDAELITAVRRGEIIPVYKDALMDTLRLINKKDKRATIPTAEVMEIIGYTDRGKFKAYAKKPECLLEDSDIKGRYKADSVERERNRLNQLYKK